MLALQLAVNGIAVGALYALAAVGFAIIFWTTRVFHIAHGGTFVIAAYIFALVLPFSAAVAVLASLAAAVAFGYLTNAMVYRPVQRTRGSFFTLFVASFGILIIVQSVVTIVAGSDVRTLPQSLSRPVVNGAVQVPEAEVVGFGVAVVTLAALQVFMFRSRIGIGLRAMADDVELVDVLGLNRRLYSTVAFVVGSALVVPAAILTTYVQGISPSAGLSIVTVALVAAIAGGVGSLPGAVVGGLVFGLVESLATFVASAFWQDAIAYAVMLAILVARPSGLLARPGSRTATAGAGGG
jgi:branched-chain amino acid transport system permease protein